ncbi:MAG: hypothetical protein K940chlam8_00673 [Chlamydiae bacterium]|nr:hypothetical protein [Chlamydiota bacterium]
MKLWQRTFIFTNLKILFFVLLGLFFLYSLIDISFHPWLFPAIKTQGFWLLPLFSAIQFTRKLHLFLPFAYLISVIYTLIKANTQKELLVLLTSGISKKRIFYPFLLTAFFVSLFTLVNTQFLVPLATNQLILIKYPQMHAYLNKSSIKEFEFEDGSFFIFQTYHPKEEMYEDVYFKKDDLLYHASYVKKEKGFVGHFVDLFKKQEGRLTLIGSFKTFPIKDLNLTHLDETLVQKDPNEHSLSMLYKMQKMPIFIPGLLAKLKSALHFKVLFLFISFLILIAVFPFATQFTKLLNAFKFYLFFIFGFLMLYLFLKGVMILVEGALVHPFFVMWLPCLLLFTLFFAIGKKKTSF